MFRLQQVSRHDTKLDKIVNALKAELWRNMNTTKYFLDS